MNSAKTPATQPTQPTQHPSGDQWRSAICRHLGVNTDMIAARAHQIYLARVACGTATNGPEDDWAQAERDVCGYQAAE